MKTIYNFLVELDSEENILNKQLRKKIELTSLISIINKNIPIRFTSLIIQKILLLTLLVFLIIGYIYDFSDTGLVVTVILSFYGIYEIFNHFLYYLYYL